MISAFSNDLSTDDKWRWYMGQLRADKERRRLGLPPQSVLDRYRNDPIGFIKEGLRQCLEESWWAWLVVLKAAYGIALDQKELDFFREVSGGRDPPPHRVKELWLIIGRRAGKDSIASIIAVNAARFVDTSNLRPGEIALVPCFATDNTQAGIVHRYIRGYFETVPELGSWIKGKLSENPRSPIKLVNRTEIRIVTNNFKAPRGYPLVAPILDECGYWKSESSASPDVETYRAMRPGMRLIRDSMLIGISSPYRKKGLLFDKWKEFFGKDDDNVLVIQAESRKFNPTLDQAEIDADLAADPEAAAAEWLAKFRDDLADYVEREVVEAAIEGGVFERAPERGIQYEAFMDPSGGTLDSFTLAIAHRDRTGRGILDLVREKRPPFVAAEACREHADDMKRYGVRKATGDRYAGVWPVQEFAKYQIIYEQTADPKSDIYRNFLPLLNSSLVDLLDHKRMVNQFCDLERRTARGGRDSIDHPNRPDAHDDICNSVAGVLLKIVKPDEATRWIRAFGT